MPSEGILTFDRFTAFEFRIDYEPNRWKRKRATHIALAFPHSDPVAYIRSLPTNICLGVTSIVCTARPSADAIVILLFNGSLVRSDNGWMISHQGFPKTIPIPENADVLIPRKRLEAHEILTSLKHLLASYPPSVLDRP